MLRTVPPDESCRGPVWSGEVFLLRPFLPATLFSVRTLSPAQDSRLQRPPRDLVWGRLVTSDKILKNSHQVKATVQGRIRGMELAILWQVSDVTELLQKRIRCLEKNLKHPPLCQSCQCDFFCCLFLYVCVWILLKWNVALLGNWHWWSRV